MYCKKTNVEKLTYRPDIDAMRAIAVLAVIGFHAFPSICKGGFVGVDVFFVISGYLISKIIFGALDTHSFSFASFYAKRVRRIFPALVFMLAIILPLGYNCSCPMNFPSLGNMFFQVQCIYQTLHYLMKADTSIRLQKRSCFCIFGV